MLWVDERTKKLIEEFRSYKWPEDNPGAEPRAQRRALRMAREMATRSTNMIARLKLELKLLMVYPREVGVFLKRFPREAIREVGGRWRVNSWAFFARIRARRMDLRHDYKVQVRARELKSE